MKTLEINTLEKVQGGFDEICGGAVALLLIFPNLLTAVGVILGCASPAY